MKVHSMMAMRRQFCRSISLAKDLSYAKIIGQIRQEEARKALDMGGYEDTHGRRADPPLILIILRFNHNLSPSLFPFIVKKLSQV